MLLLMKNCKVIIIINVTVLLFLKEREVEELKLA